MAIEIVDFPMKNGGSFHSYVNVYQRVTSSASSPKKANMAAWHIQLPLVSVLQELWIWRIQLDVSLTKVRQAPVGPNKQDVEPWGITIYIYIYIYMHVL